MTRPMTTPHLDRTRVSIPGDTAHLDVLRLVVRNACARRGGSLDEVDDAALAVHEAGLALVEGGATQLTMEVDGEGEQLTVVVTSPTQVSLDPDASMSFRIIEALADAFEIQDAGGATTIHIRLPAGA